MRCNFGSGKEERGQKKSLEGEESVGFAVDLQAANERTRKIPETGKINGRQTTGEMMLREDGEELTHGKRQVG